MSRPQKLHDESLLRHLFTPKSARDLADLLPYSRSTIDSRLHKLNDPDSRVVRISAWMWSSPQWAPLWSLGSEPNAPKPKLPGERVTRERKTVITPSINQTLQRFAAIQKESHES